MDVDSSSSSPSERLSVVCSASAEYSSNSSEHSPNSRRNSLSESVVKDEQYWERRRKNNDASKRSREKRRIGDMVMLALPTRYFLLLMELAPLFTHQLPTSSVALPSLSVPPLPSLHGAVSTIPLPPVPLLSSTSQLPIMQLCQLQAAIQQQVSCHSSLGRTVRSRFGSCSKPSTDGEIEVIRSMPSLPTVSHGDCKLPFSVPSPQQLQQERAPSQSLLGALLATRRTSPAVPQSRTEHHSRLGSPPRLSPSKSDCESISSSASFSPSQSSEDHQETSAIRRQYMDRRRRNNEAAKRCRANRRAVFEYRSRRVQLLENENDQLKEEIAKLRREVDQFKSLLTADRVHRAGPARIGTALHDS
ncbi:unnamed protein product [Heligmosomoides polygyrus]|uniref:BZIP domain-containing protein n=1 Tax=Heligmosomoides polygyrus TaxID=6339 RepID=A0A183GCR4_HELPZ|nr:unnamed protein product [Heligmosomoides polygyrus]